MQSYLNSLFVLVTAVVCVQADHSCMFVGLLEKNPQLMPIFASLDCDYYQSLSITDAGEMSSQLSLTLIVVTLLAVILLAQAEWYSIE